MKKHFNLLIFLAVALMLGSCAKDEPAGGADKVIYKFTAQLPGYIDSRAIGDGECADELFFWVYDENGHELSALRQQNISFDNTRTAEVQVPLTPGHTYSFAFWAQNKDCKVYDPNNSDRITIDYWGDEENPVISNDELRDAFYALEKDITVSTNGEMVQKTITLYRPLAQLNYGISPEAFEAIQAAGVDLTNAKVRVKISKAYTQFGLLEGDPIDIEDNFVGGESEEDYLTFEFNVMPNGIPNDILKRVWWDNPDPDGKSGFRDYVWLSFNYFLTTRTTESLINTLIEIETTDGRVFKSPMFDNKTAQGYHRTNIVTDFFTDDLTFNVVIDQNFDDEYIVDITGQSAPRFPQSNYGITLPLANALQPIGNIKK